MLDQNPLNISGNMPSDVSNSTRNLINNIGKNIVMKQYDPNILQSTSILTKSWTSPTNLNTTVLKNMDGSPPAAAVDVVENVPKKKEFQITDYRSPNKDNKVTITFSPIKKANKNNTVVIKDIHSAKELNGTYEIKNVISKNKIQIDLLFKLDSTIKYDISNAKMTFNQQLKI